MSLEAIVDKCCTSLEALRQHPFSTVKGKTKHRRLKAAQKLLRSLLQDGDLELSMTHKGVVFLRGGSAAWHEDQEEKDPKTLEALRVNSGNHGPHNEAKCEVHAKGSKGMQEE